MKPQGADQDGGDQDGGDHVVVNGVPFNLNAHIDIDVI